MHEAVNWHEPVLVAEVLHYLSPRPGAVIVDGTAGSAGHSLALLPKLIPGGRLIAIDRDETSLELAENRMAEFAPMVTTVCGNYCNLPSMLEHLGISGIDGLLLDLGMSSLQVDEPSRGFSFLKEGPLDMRMDARQAMTAERIVNTWPEHALTQLIGSLGEERFCRRIAQRIVRERKIKPVETTTQLAAIIAAAVPAKTRYGRLHPATRTFQALRIGVNDELAALEELLSVLPDVLRPAGRAVIISFHSLEDRLVKRAFLEGRKQGRFQLLMKKPVTPSEEEVARNPRARSAKLRAIERCN